MVNKYPDNHPVPGVLCKWCSNPSNNREPLEMIVKTRVIKCRSDHTKDLKSQFLGCPRFPECGYTMPITQEIQDILDNEPKPDEYVQDW